MQRQTSTWLNCCVVRPKVCRLRLGEKSMSNAAPWRGMGRPPFSLRIDLSPGSLLEPILALSSNMVRDPVLFKTLSNTPSEPGRFWFLLRRVGSVIVSIAVHSRDDLDHSEDGFNRTYAGMLGGGLESRTYADTWDAIAWRLLATLAVRRTSICCQVSAMATCLMKHSRATHLAYPQAILQAPEPGASLSKLITEYVSVL